MAGLMEFSLLSVEIKLAVEVCHCDPVVVSTDAGFSRATRILLHLLMALAKASLVDCQVRLLQAELSHKITFKKGDRASVVASIVSAMPVISNLKL